MMTITTNRPFTKSVFKTALSCPAKLFYARHKEAYANSNEEDDFLEALAEGGFQVGELAKLYEHVDVDLHDVLDYTSALQQTEQLLQRDKVVIAEAAFGIGNMFIRADIVRKDGKHIDLIEVKAKSFNPETETWMGKRQKDSVQTEWREYLYDLAFQKYVITKAIPEYDVHAFLMLADKSRVADIDNLNQLFKIRKINGRTSIEVSPDAQTVLAQSKVQVLTAFDAENVVNAIINGATSEQADYLGGRTFESFVKEMCEAWTNDKRAVPTLTTTCFKCEFCSADTKLKDGRDECWLSKAGYAPSQNPFPQVAELWSQYYQGRNKLLQDGIFFLKDIPQDRIPLKSHSNLSEGLTVSERRWLQITIATQDKDLIRLYGDELKGDIYLDCDGMRMWLKEHNVQPPYHMIDFETTAVALPYYKGMHPYEQVAFQFSHHIMDVNPDGSFAIRHAGQWLNEDVNAFPNFEFVRALKRELDNDNGTIFRYSNHENTILNEIKRQLEESNEPDKAELIAWIKTITHEGKECGARDMIDLCEIVKKFYYCYSQMHGSNSIKQVLPAVLNSSKLLQDKYSQTIYGKEILSRNISPDNPIAWIKPLPDGTIDNPYHQLPSVAEYLGMTEEQVWQLEDAATEGDNMTVANGGAALTAYNKLMFCDDNHMDNALRTALLRYCELDTMAMVFIWEYFCHEMGVSSF